MKILVAVDGSKYAVRAFKNALDLLQKLQEPSTISVISVHDDTALRHATRFVGKRAVQDYLADVAREDTRLALAAADKAGVTCETIARVGPVAQVIADAATKGKFDLVVMGSKGRTAIRDLLMGSVAQRVIELSSVPVLIVK